MGARVRTGRTSQLTPPTLDANDSHLQLALALGASHLNENNSHLHLHIYALIIHWSEQ